jgi:hypothetical protein
MKGKSAKGSSSFYAGGGSNVAKEAVNTAEGFKKGGKAMMKKKGGKAVDMMGEKCAPNAARKPRMSGGKVMSSASGSGTPRGKASHY